MRSNHSVALAYTFTTENSAALYSQLEEALKYVRIAVQAAERARDWTLAIKLANNEGSVLKVCDESMPHVCTGRTGQST